MVKVSSKSIKFSDRIISFFYNGQKVDEEYQQVVSFVFLSFVGIILMLGYSFIHLFKYNLILLSFIDLGIFAFLSVQLLLSKKINNHTLLLGVGLSSLNIAIFSAAFHIGGGQSPVIFWSILLVLVANMFGKKSTVYMTSISGLLGVLILGYLDLNGIRYEGKVFSREGLVIYGLTQVVVIALVILVISKIHRKILDRSLSELELKNDQINHFIRILCHDIANPLTIIVARSNIGQRRYLTEIDQKKAFSTINRASKLVSEILDEVRAFESISEGKVTIDVAPIDLNSLIEDIDFVFKDRLAAKNLSLKVSTPETESCMVLCEQESFKNHVISNLVSNAIKFSNEGDIIELNISTQEDIVVFEIKDHGIGIPEELVYKLFEVGEKTSRIGTNGERGTGFGLPLVKTYIELYKGEITVQSKEKHVSSKNHGTSFKISLKNAA